MHFVSLSHISTYHYLAIYASSYRRSYNHSLNKIILYGTKIADFIKKIMTTQQIAERLAELCKANEFEKAQIELYADDVISIEPVATEQFPKETKGKDAVLTKIRKFNEGVEESYGNTVSTPLVAGNAIAFTLAMDVKMKGQERMSMGEICVYEVKDGKVISEQFFY